MSCWGLSRDTVTRHRCPYATFVVGALVLALGVLSFFTLQPFIRHLIEGLVVIKKDSPTFRFWTHPPADVYFEIYLMNVTNPEAAAAGLEKPNLVNQGPYTFYEVRRKLNVTFFDNGTLSFFEPVFYFWNEERSLGNKLSDKITQLDLIVAGLSYKFSLCQSKSSGLADCAVPFLSQNVLPFLTNFEITNELFNVQKRSIFKTYTVGELLFKGYVDPFLTKFKKTAEMVGERLPRRVGLMWDRNGSANGVYTIESGKNGIRNYSNVIRFNGESVMHVWKTDYANRITGTIGHGFRPFLEEGDTVQIYAGDLCRSSELEYYHNSEVDGVRTFVYKPPRNASNDPNNKAFCFPDKDHCPPVGLMDETACFKEPSFMGKPHFFESDPLLGSVFTGLNPNEADHNTVMHIEPYTGAVIDVDKRLMMYFPVRKSFITSAGNIFLQPNVRDNVTTIFPMFWVNETAKIRQVVTDQLHYMIYPALGVGKYAPFGIMGLGIVITATAVFRISYCIFRNEDDVTDRNQDENSRRRQSSSDIANNPQGPLLNGANIENEVITPFSMGANSYSDQANSSC